MIVLIIQLAIAFLGAYTAFEEHQPLPKTTAEVSVVVEVEASK